MNRLFPTVAEIADVLRCEADTQENRLKQAGHWLTVNPVPFIRRGKRNIDRRADVEKALDDARENSLAEMTA